MLIEPRMRFSSFLLCILVIASELANIFARASRPGRDMSLRSNVANLLSATAGLRSEAESIRLKDERGSTSSAMIRKPKVFYNIRSYDSIKPSASSSFRDDADIGFDHEEEIINGNRVTGGSGGVGSSGLPTGSSGGTYDNGNSNGNDGNEGGNINAGISYNGNGNDNVAAYRAQIPMTPTNPPPSMTDINRQPDNVDIPSPNIVSDPSDGGRRSPPMSHRVPVNSNGFQSPAKKARKTRAKAHPKMMDMPVGDAYYEGKGIPDSMGQGYGQGYGSNYGSAYGQGPSLGYDDVMSDNGLKSGGYMSGYGNDYSGYGDDDHGGWTNVFGAPGVDYPAYSTPPMTGFSCADQMYPGYYADVQSNCQAFYICQADGRQDAFLCPNATIFNQQYFVCDWYYNVDCAQSKSFYSLNGDLYRENLANVAHGGYGADLGNGYGSSFDGDSNYKLGGYGVIPVSYSSGKTGSSNSDQTLYGNGGQAGSGGSTYDEGNSNGGVSFDSEDDNSNGQQQQGDGSYGSSSKNQGQTVYVNSMPNMMSSSISVGSGQKTKKRAGKNLRIQVGDRWSSDSWNVPRYSSKGSGGIKSRSSGVKGRTIGSREKKTVSKS